ncbi:hypothetical protein HPB50_020466 [Hyalomma asiaticum]|uniref:Uncharacterized protein n=1 Tax=Hyalomma asiaticum TaxID=266040 RepID=A0ACB7T5N6_HYAAI|nr:hypothetical protein HPB50_020466 [Hyalomma asiaticum]
MLRAPQWQRLAQVPNARSRYGSSEQSPRKEEQSEPKENQQPPMKEASRSSHRSGRRRASAPRRCSHNAAPLYSFQRLSPELRLRAS